MLCVLRVDSLGAAMKLIDEHEFGNGTCLFTRDGEAARYFTDNIQVGMVGVNVALPVPVASQSLGAGSDHCSVICMCMARMLLSFIPAARR